jgi:hypothetical protein
VHSELSTDVICVQVAGARKQFFWHRKTIQNESGHFRRLLALGGAGTDEVRTFSIADGKPEVAVRSAPVGSPTLRQAYTPIVVLDDESVESIQMVTQWLKTRTIDDDFQLMDKPCTSYLCALRLGFTALQNDLMDLLQTGNEPGKTRTAIYWVQHVSRTNPKCELRRYLLDYLATQIRIQKHLFFGLQSVPARALFDHPQLAFDLMKLVMDVRTNLDANGKNGKRYHARGQK